MPVYRFYCVTSSCVLGLLLLVGCSSKVNIPPVSPSSATAAALEQYDKNSDGALDLEELKACPPLLAEINEYDLSGDRKIDESELLDRITDMYEAGVGLTNADCKVTLNGKPLKGATVRYVPDMILGENTTKSAEGVTDANGFTKLKINSDDLPEAARGRSLMQVGLYRVEITHPTEQIPAKYNTETEFGFELHPYRHEGPHGVFDMITK